MKKLNKIKNIIEIDLEIRSCKFAITQTTSQSRNSHCNCRKLLMRQDFFFLVKNPMNNYYYLILILGQMKHYSENSHGRPQNVGETRVIYPKLMKMEKNMS